MGRRKKEVIEDDLCAPYWCLSEKGFNVNGTLIPLGFKFDSLQNISNFASRHARKVQGKLPITVLRTGRAMCEAYIEYNAASIAYRNNFKEEKRYIDAWSRLDTAIIAFKETAIRHHKDIITLFEKECPDLNWDVMKGLIK